MNHSSLRFLACLLFLAACSSGGDTTPPDGAVDTGVADGAVADSGTDAGPAATHSVVTHHNGPTRDGVYVAPTFTRAAVSTIHEDTGFTATVNGPVYAHPLYFDAGPGGRDLLIVATEHNDVSALDAMTGAEVWHVNLGAPIPLSLLPCGNIDPLGITGTPYLDVVGRTIYLDAMLRVGSTPKHNIFALSLDDGTTRAGWPVDVDATARSAGLSFTSPTQNERGAVLLVNGVVYVPYGGHYGDCGTYHGWVVGVPVANPSAPMAWATRARGAGSWGPGGVASDGTDVFTATGNGFGSVTWSDQEAVVRLHAGPTFSGDPMDYWSPANWMDLDSGDVDLGGSGPVLAHIEGATPADVAIALGKDGNAYVVDRGNMGGIGAPVAYAHVSTGAIITAASAYPTATGLNVVFHGNGSSCPAGMTGDLTALAISATSPPVITTTWCASEAGAGSPIVTTTDGHSESIVWTVGSEASNTLRAFDGDTGASLFRGTTAVDDVTRFVSPIIAKGRLYVAGNVGVHAFVL